MYSKLGQLVEDMLDQGIRYEDALREFEKRFIGAALSRTDGSVSRAAELLGIHRNTASRKIDEFKLKRKPRV